VPKRLLIENGAPTAADKRLINDGIEDLHWVATLKPTTIGVSAYQDAAREYLEIAVLCLTLRAGAKASRLVELVHRAVPYPALLIASQAGNFTMSAVHIRWSQGEAGKTVFDGDVAAVKVDQGGNGAFLEAMAIARQPNANLYVLYQGWIDTLLALQSMRLTGAFKPAATAEHAAARRKALQECERLEKEIARIRSAVAKETQLSRQVQLNLELKRLQAAHAAARAQL
jgi:hypothetical protein